jgi:hypothetical protein
MATKAEEFRYWTERSGKKKPKSAPRRRRDVPVDTALQGTSASDRKAVRGEPSARAGKKAAYALERSTAKPSRRSTRKAGNRQRTDTQMQAKSRIAESRPRGGTGRPAR